MSKMCISFENRVIFCEMFIQRQQYEQTKNQNTEGLWTISHFGQVNNRNEHK